MNKKLFIGGLAWGTNNDSLKAAFSKFGEPTEAKVVVDKVTGKSKGFGFVAFDTQEEATQALEGMNNQMLDGRTIKVDYATEKPPGDRPPRSGGGFGGGGGRDGGGYGGGGGGNRFGGNNRR